MSRVKYEGKQDTPTSFIQNSFRFSSCTELVTRSRRQSFFRYIISNLRVRKERLVVPVPVILEQNPLVERKLGIAEDF